MVLLFGNSPRYGKSVGLYWKKIIPLNCHDCWLLDRKVVSKYGFLYRCEHTVALTTKELQKNCPKMR